MRNISIALFSTKYAKIERRWLPGTLRIYISPRPKAAGYTVYIPPSDTMYIYTLGVRPKFTRTYIAAHLRHDGMNLRLSSAIASRILLRDLRHAQRHDLRYGLPRNNWAAIK